MSAGEAMAQQAFRLEREKLTCSICLDLLTDPVTIPCGHSYCMDCIKAYWDKENKESYACPQCRQDFTPRPMLVKNTMFAEIVEDLKKAEPPAASPDHFYAGPEDVACDFCTERKLKALKSCLVCLASYCEQHLQPHYEVAPLQKHKLVEATKKLQENLCPHHGEEKKIYCRTDKKAICHLCSMDQHKGHNSVSIAAEWAKKQTDLTGNRKKVQQRIRDRQKEVKMLHNQMEPISRCADEAVMNSEKVFQDLISLIEKRSSEVTKKMRNMQKTEVGPIKKLQEKIQQEIEELKRKDSELEQLSLMEDQLDFINSYQPLSIPSTSTILPSKKSQSQNIENLMGAVLTMRDELQMTLSEEVTKSTDRISKVTVQEPKTRAGFLKYAWQVTLDPMTANPFLALSAKNRKTTLMDDMQACFSHPDMFLKWWQVLASDGLTGRCYWEVNWRGEVFIAVAYKDIGRIGSKRDCAFGHFEKSWALRCASNGYSFHYNGGRTLLPGPLSHRVGVYLDYSEGTLSFYSITETMTLLHKVQTRFTQPLYPGFWLLNTGDSAELKFSM